tara:strand:+ start:629 stop:1426 length:798 start_codon:yes stop_codon:yes gene_type:complete
VKTDTENKKQNTTMSETKANVARPKKGEQSKTKEAEPVQELASTADTELATPWTSGRSAEVEATDLQLPRMNIVAKVGPLSEEFPPQSIIIDGDAVISDGKVPVNMTVIQWNKSYVEHIPWGEGEGKRPEVLYSTEEVYARGGTLDWYTDEDGNRQRPTWDRTLNLQVLVKKPDEMEDTAHFPFEFDGGLYALCAWTLTRTAYSRAAKKFFTAFGHQLKGNVASGTFNLTTHVADIAGNKVVVPEVRYGPRNSEEFVEWVSEMTP